MKTADILSYDVLKQCHRSVRENLPEAVALRTHRALSWLQRSERKGEDKDAQYIFLWIAFNAAYASEIYSTRCFSERRTQIVFLKKLLALDTQNRLYHIVWKAFPQSIRLLIDNPYIYQPFWDYQKGRLEEAEWKRQFAHDKAAANRALGNMDTRKVLAIIFDRLYVLRNQLIHGGATWNSRVNRSQVRDGGEILGKLVPVIILLMLESRDEMWGDAAFPVIQ